MERGDEQFERDLESAFSTVSFTEYFPQIAKRYEELGFTDRLSDSEKIQEAWWIVQQLRKFMGKQRAAALSMASDLDGLIELFERMRDRATETCADRRDLIYHVLRDEWISRMIVSIDIEKTNREENDGTRADEW